MLMVCFAIIGHKDTCVSVFRVLHQHIKILQGSLKFLNVSGCLIYGLKT